MSAANKKTLLVISAIGVVNALGYGIIIPLQYAYVARFGLDPLWFGLLFAAFSLAQFIATPIIGRLSDRFGRKPLLLYSVLGTAVSFILFAMAKSIPLLFFARILDGISGGNISVAQAVISDSTEKQDRAKWFGILGASFGFGFVVGPAIGGILSGISITAPFYFAGIISLVASGLVAFMLKETLPAGIRETKHGKLFDLSHLLKALFEPYVGLLLAGNFLVALAFAIFILGFQAFTNDVLKLSPRDISLLFLIFGVISLPMQGFAVGKLVKRFSEVTLLTAAVIISLFSFIAMGLSHTFATFALASVALAIGNSLFTPVISALLSKHARKEDQGGIMGLSQSYVSLGNILGPLAGGLLAAASVQNAFFGAAAVLGVMSLLVFIIARETGKHVVDL